MAAAIGNGGEVARGVIAVLERALAAVQAGECARARRALNEYLLRTVLVGASEEDVALTVDAARRAIERISSDPPGLDSARIEIRHALEFWKEHRA